MFFLPVWEMDSAKSDGRMEGWLYLFRSNRFGLQYSRKRYFILEEKCLKSFKSKPSSDSEVIILFIFLSYLENVTPHYCFWCCLNIHLGTKCVGNSLILLSFLKCMIKLIGVCMNRFGLLLAHNEQQTEYPSASVFSVFTMDYLFSVSHLGLKLLKQKGYNNEFGSKFFVKS